MTMLNGTPEFDTIPDAIEAFCKCPNPTSPAPTPPPIPTAPLTKTEPPAQGEFLIVLDAQNRENEGDLIIAAQDLTPAKAAFLIRHTSGYLCAPLTAALAAKLELPQMVNSNTDPKLTAYTVSVDAADPSVTTGISAHDRATTCRALADPLTTADSFRRPGHVIPLQARDGGVRVRPGHTEATVDFCLLAGKRPVGVIGEIVDDGIALPGVAEHAGSFGMLRRDGCLAFGRKFGLKVVTIEDLISYLDEREGLAKTTV